MTDGATGSSEPAPLLTAQEASMSHLAHPPFNFGCWIGGEEVTRQRRLEIRYPFTGEVVGSVPILDPDDVVAAIKNSAAVRVELSRYERSRVLLRMATRLEAEADAVSRLITWESGLCRRDTRHEVARALDVLRFAAAEALRDDGTCWSFDVSPASAGKRRRGYTIREPVRVVAAITPFNHPLNQVVHKVAPAIAAGARVVLKPSEKTPLTAVWLARALSEAGLPPGMLNVVTGNPGCIGPILCTHPDVEVVSFTGGVAIGKRIASIAGYRRVVLELGGNDPLIVMDDADLDEATRLAVSGCYANSGQRCTAVKRLIVHQSVADAFAKRLVEASARIRVGDPQLDATEMGTVISEDAAIALARAATETISRGARLLHGNQRKGALYGPTVLDDVPHDAPSVVQETFGPHAPILRVRDADEAIRVANSTPYGLSAGVCTSSLSLAHRFVRELRCGTVNIREVPGLRTETTPFGGVKDSGLGVKEGVTCAIQAMTNVKLYTMPWD